MFENLVLGHRKLLNENLKENVIYDTIVREIPTHEGQNTLVEVEDDGEVAVRNAQCGQVSRKSFLMRMRKKTKFS